MTNNAGHADRRRVVVATDVRLIRDADGFWWSSHPSLSTATLSRYLEIGLPVILLGREVPESSMYERVHRLYASNFRVQSLGNDDKSESLIRRALQMIKAILTIPIARGDVVIVRIPEVVSFFLAVRALQRRATVISNVVGEPHAISGNMPSFGGLSDRIYRCALRALVRRSTATVYVTEWVLQQQMPAAKGSPTITASNVRLDPTDLDLPMRNFGPWNAANPMRVVAVGSLETRGKGYDLLIAATARLRADGLNVTLDFVGEGAQRPHLESLSNLHSIPARFHGHIADRAQLSTILDACDVFAMPSRSEGLPRAMIEAMARGLCVVGARVGGIVELAPSECLFAADDPAALAQCLSRLYACPQSASACAAIARERARVIAANADPARVTQFLRLILEASDAPVS